MALFGYLKDLETQIVSLGFSPEIINFLIDQKLPITPSKLGLGKDITAISSIYEPKSRFEIPYESHKRYIDLQYVLSGSEVIEVNAIQNLIISKEYHEEKDVIFYDDSIFGSSILMTPGMISVLFPEDAHIPGIVNKEKETVSKIVIKYPIKLI